MLFFHFMYVNSGCIRFFCFDDFKKCPPPPKKKVTTKLSKVHTFIMRINIQKNSSTNAAIQIIYYDQAGLNVHAGTKLRQELHYWNDFMNSIKYNSLLINQSVNIVFFIFLYRSVYTFVCGSSTCQSVTRFIISNMISVYKFWL